MNYILVIWTAVSISGSSGDKHLLNRWVTIGDFGNEVACQKAAGALGVEVKDFRCLKKY